MSALEYNKQPISLREGKIFLDGVEIVDGVTCQIKFTPDLWTGRGLGERSPSSRWLGYTITGTITRRRSTNWLQEKIREYLDSGATPELTIQGIGNDENSDYYQDYGTNTITAVGCVLTGDMNLIDLDSGGQVVEDVITFKAKKIA